MKQVEIQVPSGLRPGQSRCVELEDGRPIALFNVDGEIFALDNTCPHAGGPLGEGSLDGEVVSCPWHGWKFNVKTGDCLKNPIEDWRVTHYPVRLQDSSLLITLPDSTDP